VDLKASTICLIGAPADIPCSRQSWPGLSAHGAKSVLEVGCGTRGFASLLMDGSPLDYHGFDFSDVAVRKASLRTGRKEAFSVADAASPASYEHQHDDAIVCTEVLEHIPQDIQTISHSEPFTLCV